MNTSNAHYGIKASKPGRACVRSRDRSHAVGLIVGRNRDGDFTYHHCADLQITADPSKPIDRAWPATRK